MKKALIKVILTAMTLVTLLTVIPLSANASSSNKSDIFSYLTQEMGLNSAAACGIMANIEKESDFRPGHIIRDSNGLLSGGLCQWNGSRLSSLRSYCNKHGLNYLSVEGQLRYLEYELNLSQYKHILNYLKKVSNNSSGAYDAAHYWCYYFEIPANRATRAVQRARTAVNSYWPVYGNKKLDTPDLEFSSSKKTFDIASSLTLKWSSGGDNADEYKLYVTKKNSKDKYDWEKAKVYTTEALKQKIKASSLGIGDYAVRVKAVNHATGNYKYSKTLKFSVECLSHEYTGKVTSYPTLKATGKEKLTCDQCGFTKTEKLPKLTVETLNEYPMTTPKAKSRSTDSITLQWSEYQGATGYYVYCRVNGKWERIATVSDNLYTVEGLLSGTKYKFAIKAYVKSDGKTYRTGYSASYSTATRTDAVKLKSVKAEDNGEAVLKWTAQAKATGYAIYMSVDGVNYQKVAMISDSKDTAHRITGLKKGKTYHFRVHTYVKVGDQKVYSAASNEKSAKIPK